MNKEEIFISSSRLSFASEILPTTSSQGAAMDAPHTWMTACNLLRAAGDLSGRHHAAGAHATLTEGSFLLYHLSRSDG